METRTSPCARSSALPTAWATEMEPSDIIIPAYLVILFALAIFGLHRSHLVYLYYRHRHRKPRAAGTFADLPAVTVQLPLFNEMYVA